MRRVAPIRPSLDLVAHPLVPGLVGFLTTAPLLCVTLR